MYPPDQRTTLASPAELFLRLRRIVEAFWAHYAAATKSGGVAYGSVDARPCLHVYQYDQ